MRIFGFEIKRVSKPKSLEATIGPPPTREMLMRELIGDRNFQPAGVRLFKRQQMGIDLVVFPDFDRTDPFLVGGMNKAILELKECYTKGYLSICDVDRVITLAKVRFVPSTQICYDKLRAIHCVKFGLIPAEAVNAIPYYLNHIFSEGRMPPEWSPDYEEKINAISM